MGSIVCAQLRENTADVALDGRFLDGELVGDLLVVIASSNQTKHINLARAQLILGSVLSQLRRDFGRYSLDALVCSLLFGKCSARIPASNISSGLLATHGPLDRALE